MSTSDQQGNQPLTRKQLREIRLTGATPVIGEEEAAAAKKSAGSVPAAPLPRPAAPTEVAPPPVSENDVDPASAPLTRRQARAQERIRTASVPVVEPEKRESETVEAETIDAVEAEKAEPEAEALEESDSAKSDASAKGDDSAKDGGTADEVVSSVPVFAPVPAQSREGFLDAAAEDAADEDPADAPTEFEADVDAESDEFSTVFGESREQAEAEDVEEGAVGEGDELPVADAVITGERPVVSPAFGQQMLETSDVPSFAPSFDDLITSDSGGSNRAPNTLIFTHPGEGSLSGPVASTGEVLITGSYELPRGIGSQGHAHGTTDGKEVDAVLIDGELPPSSSPTPIAASSAVSTVKPAGEVIRPPAPDKGNRLMLTLAITAGGLALLVAAALIVAFTTNVLG